MGQLRGFLEHDRKNEQKRSVTERLKDYNELYELSSKADVETQAARCMECGIPFCHSGCPLGNLIPDFNDYVYRQEWRLALDTLHKTNNFPEFTGRLCPAPCEHACVLGIIDDPVSIESIEKYIVETGFENDWIQPNPPANRTGKTVAVIGSGPSGLAAAQQLNRAGHSVTVFERDAKVGGLLRYGVPDFKLEKTVIDRRIDILEQEGITFKTNAHIGKNTSVEVLDTFDAVLLTTGATVDNRLPIPNADAKGVVQAMHFLKQQNNRVSGKPAIDENNYYELQEEITATDKHVIVIGGGDTGSDCIGTSNRHGAKSVTNFELLDKPSVTRTSEHPWPYFSFTLKDSTSHEEGVERSWNILTKEFIKDEEGNLKALRTVNVTWNTNPETGKKEFVEVEGSEKVWDCDLALIAIGFRGPEKSLAEQLGIESTVRSNYKASNTNYQTNKKHIFAAGDCRRGQSLIVWAISEGREAAYHIDTYLMGKSYLPTKGTGDLS